LDTFFPWFPANESKKEIACDTRPLKGELLNINGLCFARVIVMSD